MVGSKNIRNFFHNDSKKIINFNEMMGSMGLAIPRAGERRFSDVRDAKLTYDGNLLIYAKPFGVFLIVSKHEKGASEHAISSDEWQKSPRLAPQLLVRDYNGIHMEIFPAEYIDYSIDNKTLQSEILVNDKLFYHDNHVGNSRTLPPMNVTFPTTLLYLLGVKPIKAPLQTVIDRDSVRSPPDNPPWNVVAKIKRKIQRISADMPLEKIEFMAQDKVYGPIRHLLAEAWPEGQELPDREKMQTALELCKQCTEHTFAEDGTVSLPAILNPDVGRDESGKPVQDAGSHLISSMGNRYIETLGLAAAAENASEPDVRR